MLGVWTMEGHTWLNITQHYTSDPCSDSFQIIDSGVWLRAEAWSVELAKSEAPKAVRSSFSFKFLKPLQLSHMSSSSKTILQHTILTPHLCFSLLAEYQSATLQKPHINTFTSIGQFVNDSIMEVKCQDLFDMTSKSTKYTIAHMFAVFPGITLPICSALSCPSFSCCSSFPAANVIEKHIHSSHVLAHPQNLQLAQQA